MYNRWVVAQKTFWELQLLFYKDLQDLRYMKKPNKPHIVPDFWVGLLHLFEPNQYQHWLELGKYLKERCLYLAFQKISNIEIWITNQTGEWIDWPPAYRWLISYYYGQESFKGCNKRYSFCNSLQREIQIWFQTFASIDRILYPCLAIEGYPRKIRLIRLLEMIIWENTAWENDSSLLKYNVM